MHRNHQFGQPPWPAEQELTLAGEVALPERLDEFISVQPSQLRRAVKARGHFPTGQAAMKCLDPPSGAVCVLVAYNAGRRVPRCPSHLTSMLAAAEAAAYRPLRHAAGRRQAPYGAASPLIHRMAGLEPALPLPVSDQLNRITRDQVTRLPSAGTTSLSR